MKIVICFRNGFNLTVTCDEFSLTKNGLGNYTGYEIKGITDNKPLYINWSDIICIYRVMEGDAEWSTAMIVNTNLFASHGLTTEQSQDVHTRCTGRELSARAKW